jgi:hypothetical protein
MHNPYLEEWERQLPLQRSREERIAAADAAGDLATAVDVLAFRKALIQKYAHAIPTAQALDVVAQFSPIIEIAAGTGYWAWLLRQLGADIICYDKDPPGSPESNNRFHGTDSPCWTEVLKGDETAIQRHPDRTLFLCWPPPHDEMPLRALNSYRGDTLIYIGDLPIGRTLKTITIDHQFILKLLSEWLPVQMVELPHWEICWDDLYIFKRKHPVAQAFPI